MYVHAYAVVCAWSVCARVCCVLMHPCEHELCDNLDNKIIETINFIVIKIIVFLLS